ncbi:hypothetical protein LCGC14_0332170 [marine sediment metagenome]|uniref:Uncharacterized protein n=1 Tax=marine sediment metagenome TaxID=412755 RepID=A0A0F9WNK2_9ZZZZ
MPPTRTTRTGREPHNGFEINLYGLLPDHLIRKDQDAAPTGLADIWDPSNSRLEKMGESGDTEYTIIADDPINRDTVAVFSGTQQLADDGDGNLTGDGTGTVNYETGRVLVTFAVTTEYPVFLSYLTGAQVEFASQWDQDGAIWDRMARLPIIQRFFWPVELESTQLVDKIEEFADLNDVDKTTPENLIFRFQGYGFPETVADIDLDTSRALLRSLRDLWQTKAGRRSWFALLRTLDYEIEVFELWKSNPFNLYGDDPGEFYSRIERTDAATIGPIIVGGGNDTDIVNFQFDFLTNPADPLTLALRLDAFPAVIGEVIGASGSAAYAGTLVEFPLQAGTLTIEDVGGSQTVTDDGQGNLTGDGTGTINYTTGAFAVTFDVITTSGPTADYVPVDSETLTVDPVTGAITGSLAAVGQMDLEAGDGFINFNRLIRSSQFLRSTYNTIITPFRAARVDLEFDIDDTVPHKAGDRAVGAILGAVEVVRPIHVLIRTLNINIPIDETASISEGGTCGPNQADLKTYTYPTQSQSGVVIGVFGLTLYNGTLAPGHLIPGTLSFTDLVGSQQIFDDGHGGLVGDGSGSIDYQSGYFVVTFNTATGSAPTAQYRNFNVQSTLADPQIERYMADLVDLTSSEGNLVEFTTVEAGQPDDVRTSFEDEARIEGDFLEITVTDPPNPVTVLTF